MSREIRIYVEGGGDSKANKVRIRRGFGTFLRQLRDKACSRHFRWSIIAAGPRNSAFRSFQTALQTHPDAFNVLLVDSEAPVNSAPWQHLRQQDNWDAECGDEHCHLMVQVMEAWFVADIDALREFYGHAFQDSAIPRNPDVEQIDKADIASALTDATRHTQKGRYHEIHHGAKLLERINPAVVRSKARHCDRLFATLSGVLE